MGLAGLAAAAPAIGQLAGPVLSSLFAPDGQELSSFEGHAGIDPVQQLQNVNTLLGNLGRGVAERAYAPITLPSSYVQQVPVFSGGGLPMPIGVVGSDPALANPSLMGLQGMGQFQNLFNGVNMSGSSTFGAPTGVGRSTPPGAGADGADSIIPGSSIDPDGPLGPDGELGSNAFDDFYQPQFDQRTPVNPNGTSDGGEPTRQNPAEARAAGADVTRRKPYGSLVRGADLLSESQPDDLDRAQAAVKLLLQSL